MGKVRHLHISGFDPDGSRYHLREKDLPFCGIYLPWCRQMGYDGTLSVEADSGDFRRDAGWSLEIMRRLTGPEKR